MTTYRNNSSPATAATFTDAIYRTFISHWITTLTSTGWTQTSDTGQIDTATVVLPAVSTYTAAPIMFYLNDSLHGTYPIYLKLEFGIGTTAARISMRMSFGYATDGACGWSGWNSGLTTLHSGASTDTGTTSTTKVSYSSAGPGYAMAYWNWTSASAPTFILVQREFNPSNGAVVSNGNWCVLYNLAGSANAPRLYSIKRDTGTLTSSSNAFCMPVAAATGSSGADSELYRHYWRAGEIKVAGASLTHYTGEIATDATFTANVCGSNRTFMATGITAASVSAGATHGLAVIWE